ncbi:hypothetical protein B0H13DRAFT_2286749 [Mycena leptocephala]|nr:hypothetical protein B0H13DRAFT_2286749 [Mycena leptocephala]
MTATGRSISLPPEIWLYIHRLATLDTSPIALAHTDRFQYVPVTDPLKDVQSFWRVSSTNLRDLAEPQCIIQDACSFVLVCRLWNSLANEILYENIRVDGRFHTLYTALERPGIALLVRSVRLSTTRFDYNCAILMLCPRLQVIVQPDAFSAPRAEMLVGVPAGLDLPEFHSLKQIYWTESYMASALLRRLIPVAPNLEYLFLTQSTSLRAADSLDFPTFSNSLHRLGLGSVGLNLVSCIFKVDLQNLTRLNCPPSLLNLQVVPVLPSLHTLVLFGSRTNIPFSTIFARCPGLRELCYDVWNSFSDPQGERSPLSCIRLHSAVSVVRDWSFIENHFGLFLSPQFPRFQRLVLHGSWYGVVGTALFTRFKDGLRAQGCQLEFPENHVC